MGGENKSTGIGDACTLAWGESSLDGRSWKPAFLSKSKDSESVGTRDEFNEIRPIENLTKVWNLGLQEGTLHMVTGGVKNQQYFLSLALLLLEESHCIDGLLSGFLDIRISHWAQKVSSSLTWFLLFIKILLTQFSTGLTFVSVIAYSLYIWYIIWLCLVLNLEKWQEDRLLILAITQASQVSYCLGDSQRRAFLMKARLPS